MSQFYRDDITGEEYGHSHNLMSFGLLQEDTLLHEFDTHSDVYHEEPERIAAELHDLVDEWLEDTEEWLESDDTEVPADE